MSSLPTQKEKVDDVKFLGRVMDMVSKEFVIDNTRATATEFSNEGFMAYWLAADVVNASVGLSKPRRFALLAVHAF